MTAVPAALGLTSDQVARAREGLRRLIGAPRGPQVVLRIGRGWPVPATPRRAVGDVLLPAVPERV